MGNSQVSVSVSVLSVAVEVAVGVALFGGVGYCWFGVIRGAARRERALLKEHARATRAHYAAVEAGEDDPIFSPDAIEQSVAAVVALADGLWRNGTFGVLDGRPDGGLVRAWARSWQSFLGTGLEVTGKPSVDLLSVVNRHDEAEDGVVVRVRLRIHCKYPKVGTLGPHHTHLDERWTFGHSGRRWLLLSVSGDPLAGPKLRAPLIPTPSSDTDRLREESLAESANRQKMGDDVDLGTLVGRDDPPAFALLDLSVVDSRFESALIAAQLAHLIEVWEEAVNGSEEPLEELTSNQVKGTLLRPARGTRLIVRDAVLKSWEASKLHLSQRPPAIEVTLDVQAVRYVVRDNGTSVAGNRTDAHQMALTWALELTDSAQDPWRLTKSNNPAEGIPGWP
ncbi:MAG TPA: hypothetical protein VGG38_21145 [Acidimicrobiales bacterium]|jgi:hypothetical protein